MIKVILMLNQNTFDAFFVRKDKFPLNFRLVFWSLPVSSVAASPPSPDQALTYGTLLTIPQK